MQSIPQSASDAPFRARMPATLHFELLGFKPERIKKL